MIARHYILSFLGVLYVAFYHISRYKYPVIKFCGLVFIFSVLGFYVCCISTVAYGKCLFIGLEELDISLKALCVALEIHCAVSNFGELINSDVFLFWSYGLYCGSSVELASCITISQVSGSISATC